MKKIIYIVFLFSLANSFAQNRFYYYVDYKIDTIGNRNQDLLALQIDEVGNSMFLSDQYIKTDSTNSLSLVQKKYITPNFNTILSFNRKKNKFTIYRKLASNFYSYEQNNNIKWTIHNEKKYIGNFIAQKAIGKYGGREWTAWFTNEIPFPYGPYVFYGLPGLILQISDGKNEFNFSFYKNINLRNNHQIKIENLFDEKIINIKKTDWVKVQKNNYDNPIAEVKTQGWKMYHTDGREFSLEEYNNLEKRARKNIKLYNNPIELDEKINY